MKRPLFIFCVAMTTLVTGCAVGPDCSMMVIETAQPRPGDIDYARAIAVRKNRTRLGSLNEPDRPGPTAISAAVGVVP